MGTRLKYSVWKVSPSQTSRTISGARRSSSAFPQVPSHSRNPNGQRQRIGHSQRMSYVLNSKRTRRSWARMKPPHLHPPILTKVRCMPPHHRHMLLLLRPRLQFRFLQCQWSPQVRPPPSLACHRLRAFSQEHLPSRRHSRAWACLACLLGRSFYALISFIPRYLPYFRPRPPGFPLPPGFPTPGMMPPFPLPPGMVVPPFPPSGVTPPFPPSATPPMIPGLTPVPPSASATPTPAPGQPTAPPPLTLPIPSLAQTNPGLKKKTVLKYSEPNFSPVSSISSSNFTQVS